MIDHIKLAGKEGRSLTGEYHLIGFQFTLEELEAYTNAILEYAAVKCDEYQKRDPAEDGSGFWAAENCAEAIRQEKV